MWSYCCYILLEHYIFLKLYVKILIEKQLKFCRDYVLIINLFINHILYSIMICHMNWLDYFETTPQKLLLFFFSPNGSLFISVVLIYTDKRKFCIQYRARVCAIAGKIYCTYNTEKLGDVSQRLLLGHPILRILDLW